MAKLIGDGVFMYAGPFPSVDEKISRLEKTFFPLAVLDAPRINLGPTEADVRRIIAEELNKLDRCKCCGGIVDHPQNEVAGGD